MKLATFSLAFWIALPAGVIAADSAEPIVVLIGGNHSDPSPQQLAGKSGRGGNSGLWRLKTDLRTHEQWDAEYFNWNGTRAGHIGETDPGGAKQIETRIREQHAQRPDAPIILVGNSWGGHTAWQVCRLLAGETIDEPTAESADASSDAAVPQPAADAESAAVVPIDLVIFLDPSSFGRGKEPMPTMLPENVRQAVNYHTRNSFGWGNWLEDARLTNIDLGDSAHGFLVPGGARYDSRLDFKAHVSAEWDERVHAAIRRDIVEKVGSPMSE